MATNDTCCTIVPYFDVPDENLTQFKGLCEQFVDRTGQEEKVLYYGFSFDGNSAHCREGYVDAEGLLAHLDNVGDLLGEALRQIRADRFRRPADLIRERALFDIRKGQTDAMDIQAQSVRPLEDLQVFERRHRLVAFLSSVF